MYSSVRKIHFVGIGGIGMSAIAEILISQGFEVSGSDLSESENTDHLEKLGAKVFLGHTEKNINDSEVVVYSSAVKPQDNPETREAQRLGLPLLRRAEMLAEVSRLSYTLAVSGTHGKTTTTSICGLALIKADFDPTVIVGGRLRGFGGTNARLGKGNWTVVEADEYDRSFLQLMPTVAVVNNLEAEHMDIYSDMADLKNTFSEFANKVPFYGFVAVCLDDPGVKEILSMIKKKVVTYGLSRHCDYRAENIRYEKNESFCDVYEKGKKIGELNIQIPGLHNIKNTLAAVAVSRELGISFTKISEAVSEFTGVMRRFEIKRDRDGLMVIDDYAHHPSEIVATLKAARNGWNKRVVCVFQPHTYTRTQRFYKEFGISFDDADVLLITDIYPAREKPIEGVTGKLIADKAIESGHRDVHYIPEFESVVPELRKILKEDDILLTLGAGNIWQIANELAI